MARFRHRLSSLAMAMAVALLVGLGVYSQHNGNLQADSADWVEHTYLVVESLERMLNAFGQAESSLRGFAVTRNERLLLDFEPALEETRVAAASARRLTHDNPDQQARLDRFEPLLARRLASLEGNYRQLRDSSESTIVEPEAVDLTAAIRSLAAEMIQAERLLLEKRKRREEHHAEVTTWSLWSLLGLAIVLGCGGFAVVVRESRRRERADAELSATSAEQALMLNLGELLQACRGLGDSLEVIVGLAPRLFAGADGGAIYLFRASRDVLELRADWGEAGEVKAVDQFRPDECWALRRGRVHHAERSSPGVSCKHASASSPATVCVPLVSQGEVIGLLTLAAGAEVAPAAVRRAAVIAEQIAMAIANMQLRETLRSQSIRDPLTGLYNRRFAEETLQRELIRSKREQTSIGALAIDVDHFKRFNDTYGHDVGDRVLKEIAGVLQSSTRGGDVVSRMGGEEILVLLAHADRAGSLAKAESLRAAIARIDLHHAGASLGPITVSIGVAVAPHDGDVPETLLRAADAALYRAKRGGRNQVASAAAAQA